MIKINNQTKIYMIFYFFLHSTNSSPFRNLFKTITCSITIIPYYRKTSKKSIEIDTQPYMNILDYEQFQWYQTNEGDVLERDKSMSI